ncbi:substrate-binding domain-containing protein [Halopelagius fulvigenes]|uniref:Substrate-binding domain-containing protein n=1 Tax=Halopelagius fulvigenes TaxID=1198324 RepID=A0ABD5TYP9_9EURY
MTTTNDARGSRGSDRYPTSRRTFLAMAGATAGAGLVTGSAADGAGRAGTVTIDASPSQRAAAGIALDGLRTRNPSADVSLDVAETTEALGRFAEGEVDVLVGSRPILPDERARAAENGVAFEGREIPTDRMALLPPGAWCDCLRPNRLAETWGGDGPVETWAEVARGGAAGTAGAVTAHRPSDAAGGERGASRRSRAASPASDGTVLVRGVREFQYATGSGGVGYYAPGSDALAAPDAAERNGESTPLVRLGFLYANRESLRRRPVEEFLRTYARQSARRVGGVPYFANPIDGV